MIPLITNHSDELAEICRRHHVKRLELFGSAAVGDFNPETSDIDFLVDYHPFSGPGKADAYFGLLEDLQQLFDRRIDLVVDRAIENPYFAKTSTNTRSPYMNPEAKTLAQDILEHAKHVQNILADKTFDDYTNDINTRLAVERLFSIIGEAMNGLARHDPSSAQKITAYPRIIAFRNILIHRYSQVDNEIVWDIAQSYLPTLLHEVTTLLKDN